MPIEIISEPGSTTANSYASRSEVNAYLATRLPLDPAWETTGDAAAIKIIMARRMISAAFSGRKVLVTGPKPYYIVLPKWTSRITYPTQAIDWPREDMYDENGILLPSTANPIRLKEAQAELAGLLGTGDRTLENEILTSGLSELKAGPVELKFRADFRDTANTLPPSVLNLLVPSWYTAESIEYVGGVTMRVASL